MVVWKLWIFTPLAKCYTNALMNFIGSKRERLFLNQKNLFCFVMFLLEGGR
jgi:hypothetical protein